MDNHFPLVHIIILNWNGLKDTVECLESVFKLDYPNLEVIVVDNASTDNSVETIRKIFPQVVLIENKENLGYTGGNNIGIRYALEHGADYVWLLNNDTIINQDSLTRLVNEGEKNPKIGLLSPIIYYYDNPTEIQFCGRYINWKSCSFTEKKTIEHDIEVSNNLVLIGAALLIRTEVIKKIGYLKDKYFAYWEDTEYSIRALKASYLCAVVPSSKIYHKGGFLRPDCPIKDQRIYYTIRNKYFMFTSYLGIKKKLSFYFKFLADTIEMATFIPNDCIDALICGVWNAFLGNGGQWNERKDVPKILDKIFKKLISWHPYLWVNLLRGKFTNIVRIVMKRSLLKNL